MIMELCPNGDMFEYVIKRRHLPERLAQRWFVQLLSGLNHLHQLGVAHRDLKSENLLLDGDFNLKICDFGFCLDLKTFICRQCGSEDDWASFYNSSSSSSSSREKRSQTFCGSQSYCSPELLQAQEYDVKKNDVWACGVILYVWLYNAFPISSEQLKQMDTFHFAMIQYPPLHPPLSANCRHVLEAILQPEWSRSSVSSLRQMPWVAGFKEEEVKVKAKVVPGKEVEELSKRGVDHGWQSSLLLEEKIERLSVSSQKTTSFKNKNGYSFSTQQL